MDFEDDYEDFEGDDAQSDDPMPDDPCCDPFTATDAFFIGGAMGWAYEEGIDEGRRRPSRRKKRHDLDEDPI
jgi:hypothetical protein